MYKSTLRVKEVDVSVEDAINRFEYIVCELCDRGKKLIFCVVYRSPTKSDECTPKKFFVQWSDILSALNKQREILFIGDLNFHLTMLMPLNSNHCWTLMD